MLKTYLAPAEVSLLYQDESDYLSITAPAKHSLTMKVITILTVTACVLAICTAQAPSRGGFGGAPPNLWNMLMYRSMFDMNMMPAMALSGMLGGNSGSGSGSGGLGNMFLPLMFSGAMF